MLCKVFHLFQGGHLGVVAGEMDCPKVRVACAGTDVRKVRRRRPTTCESYRGLYAGYPEVKGARCRVVLSLEEDFAPHLVQTLLTFFEGTTAALVSAGSVASG